MSRVVTVFLAISIAFLSISAFADQYVHGYTRSNGTYVHPYYRSSPDNRVTNNFSLRGNVNPYTGAVGTNRYLHDKTSPYYQGPDSHGSVGHSGADRPHEIPLSNPVDEIPLSNSVRKSRCRTEFMKSRCASRRGTGADDHQPSQERRPLEANDRGGRF
jgi:hypothetical protein